MKKESKASSGGILKKILSGLKNSVIVSSLDRFCCYIYKLLGSGIFAWIFSRGRTTDESRPCKPNKNGIFSRLSGWISKKIEGSRIISFAENHFKSLLSCRLRVLGTYLLAFAAYLGISSGISALFSDTTIGRYGAYEGIIEALTIGVISLPFLFSKKNVSKALTSSVIFTKIISACGFNKTKLQTDDEGGKYAAAFILGMLSGVASYVIPPLYIFLGIAALIYAYIVMCVPEFGVVSMFFAVPLAPTLAMAVLTALVAFSYIVKIIRAKRVFSFEKIDLFALALGVLLIFGGLVSYSPKSMFPSMIYSCFLVGYFIVSCCVRSNEWLHRCIAASLWAGMVVAFYGIIQYVLGSSMSNAWIDSELFQGISGRAVSTLENPNMLGEYLIMILPMALALWFSGKGLPRKYSFVAFACTGMCLILTWSRGAWLGFLFALIAFLLIWNRRSMWLLVVGIFSIPFLPLVLPDTIISRFTSIGNLADSSTSYRVSIWRGAMHMARDYLFTGIGIGEDAWREIYPNYTLPGIEAAPHSHNIFIQITIEIGIFGLLFFLIILFLLMTMSFSMFAKLSTTEPSGLEKDYTRSQRLAIAGPLCGLLAVLVQGLTDHAWYNFCVYLMLWMMIGLIPALVKNTRRTLTAAAAELPHNVNPDEEASVDILITESSKTNVNPRKESRDD